MIALYRGKSLLSRLIRWFTWSPYSHAAWICRDGSVIEAWSKGVRRAASLGEAHMAGTPVEIFALDLDAQQHAEIEKFLTKQLGQKYDWWGILGFLPRRVMENHDAWFCSELVTKALNAAGVWPLLRIPACRITPGLLALSPLLRLKEALTLEGAVERAPLALPCALLCALALLLSGCASSSQSGGLFEGLAHPATNLTVYIANGLTNLVASLDDKPTDIIGALATTNTITANASPVQAWPAYRCQNFFIHGEVNEDKVRYDAIAAARASGLDCIECDASFGMSDELGMHLLKLQHPDIPGYYLRPQKTDGWFFRGQRAGVTRWIHWLGSPTLAQAQRWWFLVKDYTAEELQLKISSATAANVQTYLLNNTNHVGIVISENRNRKAESRGKAKRSIVGDAANLGGGCLLLGYFCWLSAEHDRTNRVGVAR